MPDVEDNITKLLARYQSSFIEKVHNDENDDHDPLMDVFSILPVQKRENRQYWGRELGMCWQLLVTELCRQNCAGFAEAMRYGADEPYDLSVGRFAIDTKYRIGSGDSGTLKKFKAYGPLLKEKGYEPRLVILREDNLPAAITACKAGGWIITTGQDSFNFIKELAGVDLGAFLNQRAGAFSVV